jgi:hypothetical protein
VGDEHGHANHQGDADDDDRDEESAHRLSSLMPRALWVLAGLLP